MNYMILETVRANGEIVDFLEIPIFPGFYTSHKDAVTALRQAKVHQPKEFDFSKKEVSIVPVMKMGSRFQIYK